MSEVTDNSSSPASKRPTPRRIVCVETGEVYNGAEDAARALGIAYGGSNIRIAAGNGGMAKGYHWRFEDDEAAEPGEVRGNKAVICWETGERFETAEAAAMWAGCTPKAIYAAVRLRNTAGDCHWYLADNPRPDASTLKFSRKVVCWETGEVFTSVKSAAESLGVNANKVRDAIKRGNTAGGLHWHYEGETAAAIEKAATGKSQGRSRVKTATRPKRGVTCWETGETFESADAAGASVGVKRDAIARAIRKQRQSGGYHWYWNDEPRPESFEEPKKASKPRARRAVVCWETGEIFENIDTAVAAIGIQNPSGISNAIRREGICGGYHWYWADEPRPEGFAPRKRSGGRPKRAVVCWETGEVYSCAQEAADAAGIRYQATICAAVRNRASAGGYHWYYQDEPKPDEAELKKSRLRPRAVVCWETGEIYPSATAAASTMGTRDTAYIKRAATSGEMAHGLHWYWVDQPKPDASQLKADKNLTRSVVCWETGEVFESSAKAAAAASVRSVNITEAIRKKHSSGGYHWYWADEPKPDAAELKPMQKSRKPVATGVERVGATSGDDEAVEVATSVGNAAGDAETVELAPRKDGTAAASNAEEKPRLEAVPAAANCSPEFASCVHWSELFNHIIDDFGRRCRNRAGINATQMRLLLGIAMFPGKVLSHIAAEMEIKRSVAGYSLGELVDKGLAVRAGGKVGAPVELTPAGSVVLSDYPELAVRAVNSHLGHMAALEKRELLASAGSGADGWVAAFRSWLEMSHEAPGDSAEGSGGVSEHGADTAAERGGIDAYLDSVALAATAIERIHALVAREKDCARGAGLPPSEMRALNILAVYPAPMGLPEICDRAGLDSNLGVRSIPTLRKKGLVTCAQSQVDRRVTEVSLSPTGLDLVEQTADGYVEAFEGVFPGMAPVGPGLFAGAEGC